MTKSHLWLLVTVVVWATTSSVSRVVVFGFSAAVLGTKKNHVPDDVVRTVNFPLIPSPTTKHEHEKEEHSKTVSRTMMLSEKQRIQYAFDYIVDCSQSFEECHDLPSSSINEESLLHSSCRVPSLNQDIKVDFFCNDCHRYQNTDNQHPGFILKVRGGTLSDFGWICTHVYEQRAIFDEQLLGMDGLHQRVVEYLNKQPPHPGFVASSADDDHTTRQHYWKTVMTTTHMKQLEDVGYVVLEPNNSGRNSSANHDSNMKQQSYHITEESHKKLSTFLVKSTGDVDYRTDLVHFLTRPQAIQAGVGEHYNMLLSITAYLNAHLTFQAQQHKPISPGTLDAPLTIPRMIQLAQYAQGGFYQAHSDNAICNNNGTDKRLHINSTKKPDDVRNNFRQYTCILYGTDLDDDIDGGALRLYLNSQDVRTNADAVAACSHVDIVPKNGRLLVFDSCLVHSVEPLLSSTKMRRALTLWILRPNDSPVVGERYF